MTLYTHRLTLIIPAARCDALNSWVKANLDPTGADWFTPSLSPDGNAPATHAICGVALTVPQLKQVAGRLATLVGASLPGDWDTRTRAQKHTWLRNAKATLAGIGIYLLTMDNDGTWEDYAATLAEVGVQPVSTGPL